MRTIRFDNEADLGALARRAYRLGGRGAEEKARRAERALLEANPHLESVEDLRRGAVVLVPEVPGVVMSARVEPAAAPAAEGLGTLAAAVERLGGVVDGALEREREDSRTAAKLAGSGRLRNTVKREAEDLVGRLDDVVAGAKAAAREAEASRKGFTEAFAAARQDLSDLEQRLS